MKDAKMFILRLFYADKPFEQLEARLMAHGQLTLGRDPDADWPLPDPEGTTSRAHCTLSIQEGRMMLVDKSINGTFLDGGERIAPGQPVELQAQQMLHFGAFNLLVEDHQGAKAGCDLMATTLSAAPHITAPLDWVDGAAAPSAGDDASLLEAFCEGAKLDASALSSEDPVDLMRRLGAIYQQTILGLSTLMTERARVKSEFSLEHTKISAADNNPFKWSPTRRLAQDLLRTQKAGFLSDAEAVRASFEDVLDHLTAVSSGANETIDDTLIALSPAQIEAEAKSQRGLLKSQSQTCWDLYNRRYATLTQDRSAAGQIGHTFKKAYGRASKSFA